MGTTAEKGAYIIETKSLLKDKINNLGGSIDDNTTFRQYANQLQNVYDNLPKTEYQEGTEVNLGVTTKGKLDYDNGVVGIGQCEQNGEPTPDNPQEIKCVTGNQDVVVSGKNLTSLPNFNFETRGMTNVANNQVINSSGTPVGSWFNISPADKKISQVLKANTKYVFWRNQDLSLPLTARFYYADSTYMNVTISVNSHYATFTPTQDTVNYYLYVGDGATADVPLTISNLQIMIYEGETDSTNWEKYITPTTHQLSLGDIQLNAIGNYKDYIYKNEGKWYVHKAIYKAIFNGTETWSLSNNTFYMGETGYTQKGIPLYANSLGTICMSDKYIGMNNVNSSANVQNFKCCFYTVNTTVRLYFGDNRFNTTDAFKTWLSSNNVTLIYAMATPTDTQITDTTLINQLETLYNAHSNNGTTIITSNGDLPLVIKCRGLKGE